MNIVGFENEHLLDSFKEGAEGRYGRHYEDFYVTAYIGDEDYLEIKFTAEGILLDQTEIDNLEIDVISVDGSKEISENLRKELEYRLKELFEN